MINKISVLLSLALCCCIFVGQADAAYLNDQNITVSLGASMAAEPFANRSTVDSLASIIDAPLSTSQEFHNQSTHVWVSFGQLELDFDLQADYNLATLHFWNYYGESFDVDNIDLRFFNSSNQLIGTMFNISPSAGGPGNTDFAPILAENIAISAPQGVRFINAVLSGTNSQVDFNNLGFTGTLVPEPTCLTLAFLSFGLVLAIARKERGRESFLMAPVPSSMNSAGRPAENRC